MRNDLAVLLHPVVDAGACFIPRPALESFVSKRHDDFV